MAKPPGEDNFRQKLHDEVASQPGAAAPQAAHVVVAGVWCAFGDGNVMWVYVYYIYIYMFYCIIYNIFLHCIIIYIYIYIFHYTYIYIYIYTYYSNIVL